VETNEGETGEKNVKEEPRWILQNNID